MINLSQETEALAYRLAAVESRTVEDVVRQMLEEHARAAGIPTGSQPQRRRLSVEAIMAAGAEIAAMPVLDPRSPRDIMDDIDVL